jgi:hypothetical protein
VQSFAVRGDLMVPVRNRVFGLAPRLLRTCPASMHHLTDRAVLTAETGLVAAGHRGERSDLWWAAKDDPAE